MTVAPQYAVVDEVSGLILVERVSYYHLKKKVIVL